MYTNEVLESFDQDLADRPYLRLTIEAALAFNLNAAAAGKTLTMLASVRAMPLMAKRLGWAKATGQALWRRAADKGLGYNPLLLYHFTKRPFAKRLLNPAKWDLRQIDEEGFEIVTQELAGPELTRRAAQKSAKIIGQQGLAFLERTIGRMAEAWPKDHLLPLARELKRLGHLSGRDLYEIEVFSRAAPFSRWGVLRRFTRQTLGKKKLPSDRLKKQVVAKVKEAIKRASHGEVDLFTAAQQGPSSLEAFLNNEANFSLFKTITKHAVGPWRETPYKFFMVGYSDLKTMDKAAWWVRVAKLQKACEAHTAARHLQIIQEKVGLQNAEQLNEFFRELSLAGGRPGPWVVQTLRHEELFPARLLKVLAQELRRVDGQGKLIYQNIYARPDIAKLILQDGDQIVFRPEFWNKLPRPMREAIFDRVAEQSGEEWLSWVYGSRMANAHKANFYF